MNFSKHALEVMGYTEYLDNDILDLQFHILLIFEIKGIGLNDVASELGTFDIHKNCTAIITDSLNTGCIKLTGQDFSDDESLWLKENKFSNPFLLINFKESSISQLKGGYRQNFGETVCTYGAFTYLIKEIQEWRNETLPKIITLLTLRLANFNSNIKIKPIYEKTYGLTVDGKLVEDINFKIQANIMQISVITGDEIKNISFDFENKMDNLSSELSNIFYSALNEVDKFKQFLEFFHFIERFTHGCFKKLKYNNEIIKVFNIKDEIQETSNQFFEKIFSDSKNLSSRFQWCSIVLWNNIKDEDVYNFLEIKKIRDKLSHGERVEYNNIPVEKTRELIFKLLAQV